jgi:DNA polymerase III subunit gamma/tau
MESSLALKYRPRTFDGVVGQKAVSQLLKLMVDKGAVPQTILMTGPKGSGKTSTARVLGAALNCELEDDSPCGKCPSCEAVFDGSSLDYREIDASTNGLVGDIRRLQEELLYQTPGKCQVVVLDEAHGLSSAAANALLKTLEEAPEGVVFVLVSTEPEKIMSTIRSRCMTFQFRRVAPDVIARRLYDVNQLEHLEINTDVLVAIADRVDGALRDALMLLDQISRAGIYDVASFNSLFGTPDFAPQLISAMESGDFVRSFEILDDHIAITGNPSAVLNSVVTAIRDIMIIQGGGKTTLRASALKSRTELARRIPVSKLMAAMRVLWDLKVKLRVGEDSTSALSLAVTMMINVLADNLTLTDEKTLVSSR